MKWTSEPPTEPGFYWWRQNPSWGFSIGRIYKDGEISRRKGEWWPIKIEEPPENSE